MNPAEINALLQDCLSQFEALNNSCRFTHSQELRDRLRLALGLPAEVDVNQAFNAESEEYEPNVYDGTYSEA